MKTYAATCYVCGNSLCQEVLITSNWTLHRCRQCSLVFKVGKKTVYESLNLDEYLVFDYNRAEEVTELCGAISPFFHDMTGLNIVEIGCGTGAVLDEFRNRGAKVNGFEPSEVAAEHAKRKYGLGGIVNGYFEAECLTEEPDIFLLLDVIEHLEEPLRLFRNISDAMTSESVLLVKSGDRRSLLANACIERWSYIHLLQHVAFYSRKTMEYLCDKSGLRIVRFLRYRDVYGGIAWRKLLKNLAKVFVIALSPSSSSIHHRYEIDTANDHFIAVIKKVMAK